MAVVLYLRILLIDRTGKANPRREIGGLTISDPPTHSEVQALRDKCEELADDVRALRDKAEELADDVRALVGEGLVKDRD